VRLRLLAAAPLLLLLLLATESGQAGPNAASVTIFARPSVLAAPPAGTVTLSGTVDSGRAGELVDIEAKDCGQPSFRGVAGATTTDGGRYEVTYNPGIKTTFRAVSGGKTSGTVTVEHRAMVGMSRLPRKGQVFRVAVSARWTFWHKRVLLQQRTRRGWKTIRNVLLVDSGSGGATTGFWGYAKTSVPRGTQLRAVVTRKVAQPCYLAATSRVVRVTR
jgi:hypothetical protein